MKTCVDFEKVDEFDQKILQILGNPDFTNRDIEKKLISLLKPKNIDLIKLLVNHQNSVFFGTLL